MNLLPDLIINAIIDGYANNDFSFAHYLIDCYDNPSFEKELNYTLAHFAAKKVETYDCLKVKDVTFEEPYTTVYKNYMYYTHIVYVLQKFKLFSL